VTSSPPLVEAVGLFKDLGGRRVVDDVGLSVAQGACVALIGPNGAGKSTLLRLLVRLIEPDSGTIRLHGRDMRAASGAALRDLRRQTGFVFQQHNLVGRASVLTNVVHGALGRTGWWRACSHRLAPSALRDEAMACLTRVGLAAFAERRADRLSGGQSQRVAIARALMQRPGLLLADDPAASLDPAAGEDVMRAFRELVDRDGMTVVFTSHHIAHARAYADRIVGLRAGRVTIDAPTSACDSDTVDALYA
jgi:phosphonate transport system ATP-binding protein